MSSYKIELQGLFRVAEFLLDDSHDVPCLEDSVVFDDDLLKEFDSFVEFLINISVVGHS